jgi:hypothetical protein
LTLTCATGGGGGGGSFGLGGSRLDFPFSSLYTISGLSDVDCDVCDDCDDCDGASLKNMLAAREGLFFSRRRVVSLKRLKREKKKFITQIITSLKVKTFDGFFIANGYLSSIENQPN